jgi:hypothetical protein
VSGRNGTATRFLTREAILGASDIPTEVVNVPEWGGAVMVRGLNAREANRLGVAVTQQSQSNQTAAQEKFPIELVALAVVDEGGQRLFSDADIEALAQKSGAALMRVFVVAQRLSGLDTVSAEQLAKNSESGPSAASSSD